MFSTCLFRTSARDSNKQEKEVDIIHKLSTTTIKAPYGPKFISLKLICQVKN